MTNKEQAKSIIDALPDSVSMDDIIDALYIKIKFARGEEQIRNGQGLTTEEAKQRLAKWLN